MGRRHLLAIAASVAVLLPVLGIAALTLAPDSWLGKLGYGLASERLVTGMLVVGDPRNPVIYVSSSDPRIGAGMSGGDLGLDTNSGVISRLTRARGEWTRRDLVRGLPRSEENHATNGLALDPATQTLFVAQGSNTNEGAPSHHLAFLPEYALSGAILAVDLTRIGERTYDLPTLLDTNSPFGGDDGRNQARLVPGGPVEIYAPGYRNIYDLVLTRAGRLYTSQNGGAKGWGDVPAAEGRAGNCTNEPREPGHYDPDTLHLVRAGQYAGHPNPTRGNQANTFDGRSPVVRSNPIECDYRPPNQRGAVAIFPTSTNGLAEYTASNFGGALRGDLLAASFDTSIYRVTLNGRGDRVTRKKRLFKLPAPLDVTTQGDEAAFAGTIWVTQYDDYMSPPGSFPNLVVFEPADLARRWEQLAPTGLARQELSFVRAGGRFHLIGGTRAHQVYYPETNSWTKASPFPRTLDHIQGVEVGGRIYYVGGLAAWPRPAVNSTYAYDPATDRFESRASMPRARGAGGVAAHRGKVYYAGGLNDGRAVAWFDVYDPKTDSWSRLPDMPRARDHFQAAVVGGRFYAIGGRESELGAEIAETDVFDFASGRWSTRAAPIPTLRGGFAAVAIGHEILVIGGEDADRAHGVVEAYDTRNDRWRVLDPMPTPRHGIQAAVCGGAVYIAGGGRTQGGENPSAVNEAYLYGGRGCSPQISKPQPRERPSFHKRILQGSSSYNPTAIQFGPDGRLYAAQQSGMIKAYTVVRREGEYVVTATEEIDAVQSIPNHDDDGSSISDLSSILSAAGEKLGL